VNARVLRIGLVVLALLQLEVGLWGLLAPHSFYDHFPGASHTWLSALGPYDEHLVRDATGGFLALGVLLVWAAVSLAPALVRAALGVLLVFTVPHLAFHATHANGLSAGDNVANLAGLAFVVVLPAVLLVAIWRAERRGWTAAGERTASGEGVMRKAAH
jgi:hypothetical protein